MQKLYSFDAMNILLNIPAEIADKYQEVAALDKRSRKNLMEKVLIDYFMGQPKIKPSTPTEPKYYVDNSKGAKITLSQDGAQTQNKEEIEKLEKELKDGKMMKFPTLLTQQLYFHEREKRIKELKQLNP